jgi:hypothetical protein
MKPRHDHAPASADGFSVDLHSRLELVQGRVGAESVHLDQVAAVAESYAVPLPPRLKLVR